MTCQFPHLKIIGSLVVGFSICLAVVASNSRAQNAAPVRNELSQTVTPTPSPDPSVQLKLDDLQRQVEKLNKAPKDWWDKLSAVSGLLSGGVVALIGIVVTFKLTERRRKTDEQQKDREVTVLQVQTVQSFMPQLQSGNDVQIESALAAIKALGNSTLAENLARLYGQGGKSFLSRVASSSGDKSAKRAQDLLDRMFTVSLKGVAPNLNDLVLSVDAVRTFGDLTTQVFWGLKNAVPAFTYEKEWILRDTANGKLFLKLRNEAGEKIARDSRTLQQAGITPGITLEAIPMDKADLKLET